MKPFPQLTVADRVDIVDCVFKKKVRDYIAYVHDSKTFGIVVGVLYTIEFQKCGLPHCHSLLWINGESKVQQDVDVNKYHVRRMVAPVIAISQSLIAIKHTLTKKDLSIIVVETLKSKCRGNMLFHYHRRDTEIQGFKQGTDRVIANVTKPLPNDPSASNTPAIQIDEIKNYVEARYIGPHETCWRIIDFPIHNRNPHVQTLVVQLENMQQLKFRSKDSLQSIVSNPTKKTTLTEWLEYNRCYTDDRHLTYLNFPSEYARHAADRYCQLADLLWQTDLIIWDEAPMNDRRCFEALDHSLKDICDRPNTFFGGESIILGGDFRQNLLVKKKASKPEILDASITASYLWLKFKVYTLLENMRLRQPEKTKVERIHIQNFSSCLLNVGDDTMVVPDETDPENTFGIHIPPELCIPDSDAALVGLIEFIYDEKTLQTETPKDLQKKSNLPHGNDGGETELLYPTEYLKSLNFAGFPPHRLELKVGAPIILLRNLNISGSLCNRTRLIVIQLLSKVIEARIITGTRISEKVFLPRIPLINRDLQLPFIFKRKQFPIKLSYAMTINKSQGQSLERICIFLPQPVFAHGQFSMTEANDPNIIPTEKGKLPLVEAKSISITDINLTLLNQTIKVRGNAIQATMDLKDTDYFSELLQLNDAYRISHFRCTSTKAWDRTLPNDITLTFGRYTSIVPISNANFLEHYFNFVAYNEVEQRATWSTINSDIILPFLIWGDTAETFDMDEYNKWKTPLSSLSLLPGQPKNTEKQKTF
nr:DNA helicase [Tanacetum cinerariifolium]